MADCINRQAIKEALYEAEAITMRGGAIINDFPAADVAEVKHGKWIEEEDGYDHVFYSCSVCGAGICTIDETPIEYGWKYCPECGSKMEELVRLHEDEEDEDDE